MRKGLILFLFGMSFCFRGRAQSYDIPDYRNKKEGFKKVTDATIRSDLAAFALGGLDEAISKEPLQKVPIVEYGTDFIRFADSNIRVTINAGVFDKTKHKLYYYENKYLLRIDNKPYWGIYGDVPITTIESVTAVIGNDSISLPPIAITDTYEPRFCHANSNANTYKCNSAVYISKDKRRIYIYMLNSDGTNGYEVTWIIQDKQYLRRVVDYGF
jgi:hypothetical protein